MSIEGLECRATRALRGAHTEEGELFSQSMTTPLTHRARFTRRGVAVLASGHLTRFARSALTEAPMSFRQQTGNPHGFPAMGDVMIRRLYLAARPAGSDWRTRRLVVRPINERNIHA